MNFYLNLSVLLLAVSSNPCGFPEEEAKAVSPSPSSSVSSSASPSPVAATPAPAPAANATMQGMEGDSKGQSFAQCIKDGTQNFAFYHPFANVKESDDFSQVSYCRTDSACNCPFSGPDSVYSNPDTKCDLSCNKFCYYSKSAGKIVESSKFKGTNAPPQFFNCGAETCDNVKNCN